MMESLNPQQTLERVATVGLVRAREEDVLSVARALWHEGFVPDFANLTEAQQREAGYLVGRLARFNVVERERKAVLLKSVERIKSNLAPVARSAGRVNDPLADELGATGDLGRFMVKLLPMQTRHFVRERAG